MQRLGIGLCLLVCMVAGMAATRASDDVSIKAFLKNTDVRYGSAADSKTFEGRLYAWASKGAPLAELQTKAAKEFKLPRELADQLVLLTLQRGSRKDQDTSNSAAVDQYIALAHAYPQSDLALLEAARTIYGSPFGDCNIDANERLLQGRPSGDAERIVLFKQFGCLPLLTERTTSNLETIEPYLTLATQSGQIDNTALALAVYRAADQKAQHDASTSKHTRIDIRVRRLVEELRQGRLKSATDLLATSPKEMDAEFLGLLDAGTRRAISAAYIVLGQMPQAQAWRDAADSAHSAAPPGSLSEGVNALDSDAKSNARYEANLLDQSLHPAGKDVFDLLVEHYRLSDSRYLASIYWGGLWTRLYNRIAVEQHYPGLMQDVDVPIPVGKLADVRAEAIKRCYRCAPELLAMIDRVANESVPPAESALQANESQLPAPVLRSMDAMIAAPRPYWSEHPLPKAMRTPHPDAKSPSDPEMFVAPPNSPVAKPSWAGQLPNGELIRFEQQGQRVVAVTVSQSLDPTGELSAGGYWVSLSDDGGKHFYAPFYTGLRMFEPYVVPAQSRLPMFAGDHLQLEVAVRQLDDAHIMLPPIRLPMKAQRDDLYLDISLADLQRDTDNDGLTDIAEWAMLLDPKRADTDGDGIPDGHDPLPQVAASHTADPHASALVAVLTNMFDTSLGAIVTTSATGPDPAQAYALTSNTDNYNIARAIFIQAPAAYFSGVALHGRMIVLDAQRAAALQKARGQLFVMSIPIFEVRHDGKQALVVWSSGWVGGTYLLTKQGDKWKAEAIRSWIT